MTGTAEVVPFAFEDHLVRVVKPNGEPWFVGRDVCHVLALGNESKALGRLDPDERQDGVSISDPMGREQKVICVSEPGVYRLIFTSRKPEAERFKRWLAHEVLPQLRRHGFYAPETVPNLPAIPSNNETIDGQPIALIATKLSMVRESRLIHGPRRAEQFWDQLGLPKVPGGRDAQEAEARAGLAHLLDQHIINDFGRNGRGDLTIRKMIEGALHGVDEWGLILREHGIRVYDEGELGFAVANAGTGSPWRYFHGTRWKDNKWGAALRHYPGARRLPVTKFLGTYSSMGVWLPAEAIEDVAPPANH